MKKKAYQKAIYLSVEAGFVGLVTFLFGYKMAHFMRGALPVFGGIWCMSSSLVVLFAFVDTSLSSAKTRLVASVIGCVVGASLCYMIGPNYFSMFLSVTLTMFVSELFGYSKGVRISSCVAAVIIGIGMIAPNYSPFMNAVLRLSESLFGILFAMLVVYLSYKINMRDFSKGGVD